MKKIFTLIAICMVSISVWGYVEINGIQYVLDEKNKEAMVNKGDSKHTGSVVIPESIVSEGVTYKVTNIWDYAFYGCSGLTSVTIGNSVTFIGAHAFSGCTGLTSVLVDTNNQRYCTEKNVIYTKNKSTLVYCMTSMKGQFTIPNSVTSIGWGAFYGCKGLTSVTIPNSVTSIGIEAFRNCSGLTSVTIPNSVTSIGAWAFLECTGFTSLTIPNSVTSIDGWAFGECNGLTSVLVDANNRCYCSENNVIYTKNKSTLVYCMTSMKGQFTIPNSVTSIGECAFKGCSGLTTVTIPNSVTSIGGSAFWGCKGLTSVTLPNSVTNIGDCSFVGCWGLTSMTIPNSVTSIGAQAFWYCKGLTSVTIPNSVTSIGWCAFERCSGLTSVTCLADKVPETGSNALDNVPLSSATLNVPATALEDYKNTSPWSGFSTIQGVTKCAAPEITFSDGKLKFACETECADIEYSITASETGTGKVKAGESGIVDMQPKIKITCYATKDGLYDSNTVTKEISVIGASTGDIDGDGKVDIADVTKLVDQILINCK